MRSEYIHREELQHLLAALTPPNRLACEISLATGLRIGDVLSLRRESLEKGQRFSVRESKTGKTRRVYLPLELHQRALRGAGEVFIFPSRGREDKHRTRQAVYKDLRRSAKLFRIREHISPHSARKVWAVEQFRKAGGDLKRVQRLLMHEDEAVTMLYAMADVLTSRRLGQGCLDEGAPQRR